MMKAFYLKVVMATVLTFPLPVAAQNLPFSPVVEANGVLYLAGALGFDPETGKLPEGGIGPQTQQTLENIGRTLNSVNADYDDVVRCQVFLTDPGDFRDMNAVYKTFFPEHPPARTTVAAALVAEKALIEIECTAVRGHGDTKRKKTNG